MISGSGKSATMFGTQNAYGILNRSIELILNTSAPINVSVVEMIGTNMYDLGDKKIKLDKTKPKIIPMAEMHDFNALVTKVQSMRAQKETDQNPTSSRSHLMFYFSNNQGGKMAIVDLAGWENPKNKDIVETKFINGTLSSLNELFISIAKKTRPSSQSELTRALKPYLIDSKVCIMYHVNKRAIKSGLESIKGAVPANQARPLKRKASHSDANKNKTLKTTQRRTV